MRYYLAYGSNLNLGEMRQRAKNAEFLGKVTLNGYRLVFRNYMTAEPCKERSVEVGLFRISKRDEEELDWYEGYPHFYRKEEVEVEFNGDRIKALIYIMNEGSNRYRLPDPRYLARCRVGYLETEIPESQLIEAVLYTQQKEQEEEQ